MQHQTLSKLLSCNDFNSLFRGMGWDNPEQRQPAIVPDSDLRPVPVADKRGVTVWLVNCPNSLPKRSEQHRVVRQLKRLSRDQLVVFVSADEHLWLWPEQRPSGVGYRLVDHRYAVQKPTEALLQRLTQATFTIREEPTLTSSIVLRRVRRSFNADKVTQSFYREFEDHHKKFRNNIKGIPNRKDRRWYTSILLNRLMFIYFIQRKEFLDEDQHYLRNRLKMIRDSDLGGFYAFYRKFLLPLFHTGLGSPLEHRTYDDTQIEMIIGKVPYVNGGIFEPHYLENTYEDIKISDEEFESLFDFFDNWRWHLDENPTGEPNEINPDVLGYIFERYINCTDAKQKKKKEKGAYYTKPDVTGYMVDSTILPALANRFTDAGLDDPCSLLTGSGASYIHASIRYGVDQPLPEDWETDSLDPPGELAHSGERYCDIIHRRNRYKRLRELLSENDRVWTIDDAITENLDMRELLTDYLFKLSTAEECDKAFGALKSLTVCDPTVGSGAFLFVALEVLQPLYDTVLSRADELQDTNNSGNSAECLIEARRRLRETHRPRSMAYWTIKTICLNNLYGVDLMEEAPEIAKLRMFLKLAAQIDDVDLLEPLPDLDFNIKCGNLLVGIADHGDANRRLGEGDGRLQLGDEIKEIEKIVEQIACTYDSFIIDQEKDLGSADHKTNQQTNKQELLRQLKVARDKADTLLYSLRKEHGNYTLEQWCKSHQPFHWFVEFPSVIRARNSDYRGASDHRDGFDVVIGNPPYIRINNKIKEDMQYTWLGYKTQECPDLYAVCVERSSMLLNPKGRMSMIVMHSLCFNKKFATLRDCLSQTLSSLWISSYSRIPDGLFSGSARVRNTILVGARGHNRGIAHILMPPLVDEVPS